MKNLTWQNPEQLFVAQELINKVKSKCCGIKVNKKEDFYFYSFREDEKKKTINEAIEDYADAIWKVCALIPYLDIKDEELEILPDFISKNFNDFLVLKKKPDYSTYFKKLICFYDWRKYGW